MYVRGLISVGTIASNQALWCYINTDHIGAILDDKEVDETDALQVVMSSGMLAQVTELEDIIKVRGLIR